MSKDGLGDGWMLLIFVLIAALFFVPMWIFVLQPMTEIHFKEGKITRVELVAGHWGSTMDKTVVAFDDGSTLIFNLESFGDVAKYQNQTVRIEYIAYSITNIHVIEG